MYNTDTLFGEGNSQRLIEITELVDQVISHYDWSNSNTSRDDSEKMKDYLKDKCLFILKKLKFNDENKIITNELNFIPEWDSIIMREILIYSMNGNKGNLIAKWLNGKFDLQDSDMKNFLYKQFEECIISSEGCNKVDSETKTKWLQAFATAINCPLPINSESDKFVKVTEVFNQVISYYDWDKEDNYDIDVDSKKRILRRKYDFLMKRILFRDAKDFKEKGSNLVFKNDAPIIRELLIKAISDDKESTIVKWFNGKVKTNDPLQSFMLFKEIELVIRTLEMKAEIDYVTTNEWLSTISSSINYNTAYNTQKILEAITDFLNTTLSLNHDIDYGSLIFSRKT